MQGALGKKLSNQKLAAIAGDPKRRAAVDGGALKVGRAPTTFYPNQLIRCQFDGNGYPPSETLG
jgi:hypothetical protein